MEEEFILSWKKVSAWPGDLQSRKTKILNDVSGIAKSGSLVAVLSPSGGGKTTLLAILNKRFKGIVEGEILLNGHSLNHKQMSLLAGFVPQRDFSFETLTVTEHLVFMACLKMSYNTSHEDKMRIVLKTVEHLGLSHRLNVQIRSLSGGQRKQLALAVQLLTEPKILFCDEPTTGLDSYSATNVVKLLRKLANEKKLIVCSIHQPASGIFELFDTVSLLASNGSLVYYGSTSAILDYFADYLHLRCPVDFNLSEFVVSQVTISNDCHRNVKQKVPLLIKTFTASRSYQQLMNEIDSASTKHSMVFNKKLADLYSQRVPFNVEFVLLLWRTFILMKRASKYFLFRFLTYIMVMLCVSLPYGTIVMDQASIQNIQGLLHTFMLEILYCSLYGVILTFPDEMPIFLKESSDFLYSTTSYYISKIIVLFPKSVVEGFVYTNVVFAVTGLNNGKLCVIETLPLILVSLVGSAYGFFLSTAFTSVTTASLFSVPFEFICHMYTGVALRLRSLPWYTRWFKYVSFMYYALEALSIQRWAFVTYLPCQDEVCTSSGNEVLSLYGYNRNNLPLDYFGLISLFLIFHILGYACLLWRKKYATPY